MKDERKYGNIFDFTLLKRILQLAAPFKMEFTLATFLAVLLAVLAPIRPYIIQITVDDYIFTFDKKGLLSMCMILIGLLIAESCIRYFFIYLTNWLGQSVIKRLRVRVFSHLTSLKLQFFDKTPIGTATTRTINDVETINEIFSQGIITILAELLTINTIISVMFWTDWKLTLVSLSTFPVLIYCTYIFKERINNAFQKVRTQVNRLNTFLQEHITGMKVIQIFNAEAIEMQKFKTINNDHKKANIESIWYFSIFFPLVEVILASAIGLMVWYGAVRVIQYETTLGVLISFILLLNMLFRPLRMLADKFNTLQMGIVASDRVFKLLDQDDRIENKGEKIAEKIDGEIEFENVWFAYLDELYVLKDINFKVAPGKTLAIVGSTGSGKSSIINTLNRFYEINKGKIKIDGTDVKEYDLSSLRSKIGLVLQDVFLFSGSVYENISLRNDEINRDQVIEAAKMIGAHNFIKRLPGQYDYNVMERGATLSVGQRQLISFIRALVFDPSILILDEATSSVDTESEILIQEAIEKLVKGRTSIVIAHRLSTIQNADQIMVLDHGEIKEMGTHKELLKIDGYYKKLYDMQFKESMLQER